MSTQTRYEFVTNFFPKLDPQEVGEHLETLIEKFEEHLTPEEILADARKAQSPLHEGFEWDDSKAAEKYRKRQAKMLMKHLHLAKGGKATRTKAFVYVRHLEHGKRVYLNTRSAMARSEYKEQVIEQALKAYNRWATAYSSARQLRGIQKDIDRLRGKLERELMATI